jgi:hypothetical protein
LQAIEGTGRFRRTQPARARLELGNQRIQWVSLRNKTYEQAPRPQGRALPMQARICAQHSSTATRRSGWHVPSEVCVLRATDLGPKMIFICHGLAPLLTIRQATRPSKPAVFPMDLSKERALDFRHCSTLLSPPLWMRAGCAQWLYIKLQN